MPSINSQIQLPVIPWVLWTVCDYKNKAKDKTAIHLKLYIFIPMPPHPYPLKQRKLWMPSLYPLKQRWLWMPSLYLMGLRVGVWFEFSHCTWFNFFCSALYYWMQYLIISHFSFHAQHAKKFWWRQWSWQWCWQWCWQDSKPNFLQVLVILSLHCALSCLKSCSMIW